jgi:hypothetical protein
MLIATLSAGPVVDVRLLLPPRSADVDSSLIEDALAGSRVHLTSTACVWPVRPSRQVLGKLLTGHGKQKIIAFCAAGVQSSLLFSARSDVGAAAETTDVFLAVNRAGSREGGDAFWVLCGRPADRSTGVACYSDDYLMKIQICSQRLCRMSSEDQGREERETGWAWR